MENQFYLLLTLKAQRRFDQYGKFYIGHNAEAAHHLFQQLRGTGQPNSSGLLHIDLMETVNGLPTTVKTISCTLDEFAENCKTIAKEVFRLKNMDGVL